MLVELVSGIEERAPVVVQAYKERLHDKIAGLAEGIEIDPSRLVTEVALLRKKAISPKRSFVSGVILINWPRA